LNFFEADLSIGDKALDFTLFILELETILFEKPGERGEILSPRLLGEEAMPLRAIV